MTKHLRVNLVSYYGGWGTAVESSMIFHRHCTVTGMNIDTYADQADQNNIKAYQTHSRVNEK